MKLTMMVRRIFSIREVGIVLILAAELGTLGILLHHPGKANPLLTPANLLSTIRDSTTLAIASIGSCIVIISGGIDLAVGSVIALSCVCTAWTIQGGFLPAGCPQSIQILCGMMAGVLSGLVCGFISGTLVTLVKLPSFIATLGMMSIARGSAFLITQGGTIQIPDSFFTEAMGSGHLRVIGLEIPIPVLILIIFAAVFSLFMGRTIWGRQIYAMGGNEEAARFCGVRITRLKLLVFCLGGLFAGIAGVLFTSYYGTGQSTAAMGWELDAIAAAVVGGASLSGGRGSVVGAILGAIIFGVLRSGLAMLGMAEYNAVIIGAVVVMVVVFDQLTKRRTV